MPLDEDSELPAEGETLTDDPSGAPPPQSEMARPFMTIQDLTQFLSQFLFLFSVGAGAAHSVYRDVALTCLLTYLLTY